MNGRKWWSKDPVDLGEGAWCDPVADKSALCALAMAAAASTDPLNGRVLECCNGGLLRPWRAASAHIGVQKSRVRNKRKRERAAMATRGR